MYSSNQLKARIQEFDAFYDKNYADDRINYFEQLKMKLKKLLYTHIVKSSIETVRGTGR